MNRLRPVIVFALLSATLCGAIWFQADSSKKAPPEYLGPIHNWERSPPESQGFDPDEFEKAIAWFDSVVPFDGVDKLVVVRGDHPVWVGSRAGDRQMVWSCTKAFTTTVMGILVDRGLCDLDDRVAEEILPELEELYPSVTLHHFASMTSGYQAADDPFPQGNYVHGPSPLWHIPGPPLFPPGSGFAYWDSAMNQLGRALTRVAGKPMSEVFREAVADPIGMDRNQWSWGLFAELDGGQVNGGAGNRRRGVEISAIEMARFGQLLLEKGVWEGRRLLSEDWIERATSVQAPAELPLGGPYGKGAGYPYEGRGIYGYGWWVNGVKSDGWRLWPDLPLCAFAAVGFHNNVVFVIPRHDLVVARLGLDQDDRKISQEDYNEFLRRIASAIVKEKQSI